MQAIERFDYSQDWITILFVACFLLLVLAKILYAQRFEEFINLLGSGKFMAFKGKENKAFHGFNILMLSMQLIAVSVFIFIVYRYFYASSLSPLIIFIRIFTAYACLVLLKTGVEKIIGNIFEFDEKMDYYIFQKISYRNFISLFILLIAILLAYTFKPTYTFLMITGAIVIIANAVALFIIYRRNQSLLEANWFYFILYLCALEIAPYIILYKLITN